MPKSDRDLITTGQAAKLAGVTRETIQNHVHKGLLSAQRTPGGHYRLDEKEVRSKLCATITLEAMLT